MKIYLISFVISLVVMACSAVALYHIADYVDPPVTSDGHKYMPTENIAKAFFGSLLSGLIAFIVSVRIQRGKHNN